MWTKNSVLPGIQQFTAVQLVVSQKSWKNKKAWKLVGKEKPRVFALLYLQAKAGSFYFDGLLQIYHNRASRDPIFQGI